jgi:hypothetical protein
VSTTTTAGELASIEIRRLSTVTWISISVFYSILALSAENPIRSWQIYYISGVLIALAISILLQIYLGLDYSFAPIISYLLIAPIFLGSAPNRAWMSYGLLTLTANLYIATITRRNIAIATMLAVTIFQIWVINQDLSSISDLADMRLLNTYFSTLWTFGAGLAFMGIRARYMDASNKIEDEIVRLKDRISSRFQAISLQNRDDYRNLKLHGTILNTLIFAKNNPEFASNRQELKDLIKKELDELQVSGNSAQTNMKDSLEDLLKRRTLNRIHVTQLKVSGGLSDASLENNILEIIREMLLNLEKHTSVAEVSIDLNVSLEGDYFLRISESAHFETSAKNLEVRKSNTLRSESLKRLLAITPSQLAITNTSDGFGLVYTITNLETPDRASDPREIYRLRNSNLREFASNLGRATAVFGLLFLPGYFFLGINQNVLLVLVIHSAVVGYSVIKKIESKAWISISTFFSLALPAMLSQGISECSNLAYLPWLLNIVLMNCFIFATEITNKYLRWVPIVIITIELLILPQSYPPNCQDIFLGSTPAIPLIITFALALGSLRKRLYKQDAEQISSAFLDEANVRKYEDALEYEYKKIVSELEDFSEELPTLFESAVSIRIENEIQKIRAFLVCSEQFESEIVRELYRFVITRLRNGVPTRLSILGEFIYQLDSSVDSQILMSTLNKILEDEPSEINFIQVQDLNIEIAVDKSSLDSVRDRASTLIHSFGAVDFSFIAR